MSSHHDDPNWPARSLARANLPAMGVPRPVGGSTPPGAPDVTPGPRGGGWGVPGNPSTLGFWLGAMPIRVPFAAPNALFSEVDGVIAQGIWRSPIFDLKPQYEGAFSTKPVGVERISAVGALLRLQVTGLATAHGRSEVWAFEEGHISDPGQLGITQAAIPFRISSNENISIEFYDSGTNVANLLWQPTELVRYWRVNVVFNRIGAGENPVFNCLGGFY